MINFILGFITALYIVEGISCANYSVTREEFGDDFWVWWVLSAVFWLPLVGLAFVLEKLGKI